MDKGILQKRNTQAEISAAIFQHWLEQLLRTEQGRALIKARLRRHELPVIRFTTRR